MAPKQVRTSEQKRADRHDFSGETVGKRIDSRKYYCEYVSKTMQHKLKLKAWKEMPDGEKAALKKACKVFNDGQEFSCSG